MKKDKQISVNVSAAISAYNRRRGKAPKMTMETLASRVFQDEIFSSETGAVYLSKWNSGKMNVKKCELKHIWRMEDETGISICDLIVIS
jgi:hypothetical protein